MSPLRVAPQCPAAVPGRPPRGGFHRRFHPDAGDSGSGREIPLTVEGRNVLPWELLDFTDRTFRSFDVRTGTWEAEAGKYQLLVRHDSLDLPLLKFMTIGDVTTILDPVASDDAASREVPPFTENTPVDQACTPLAGWFDSCAAGAEAVPAPLPVAYGLMDGAAVQSPTAAMR